MKEEDIIDSITAGDDGGEAIADYPIDFAVGELLFDGLSNLEPVNDVAEGGGFDD